mmetsp:Transcript_15956/g.20976  ORF Transcript_15956/g.20976 Transcript_15956/m.20976 type:complete len:411 (+) Transcript_15956:201-1433(+)
MAAAFDNIASRSSFTKSKLAWDYSKQSERDQYKEFMQNKRFDRHQPFTSQIKALFTMIGVPQLMLLTHSPFMDMFWLDNISEATDITQKLVIFATQLPAPLMNSTLSAVRLNNVIFKLSRNQVEALAAYRHQLLPPGGTASTLTSMSYDDVMYLCQNIFLALRDFICCRGEYVPGVTATMFDEINNCTCDPLQKVCALVHQLRILARSCDEAIQKKIQNHLAYLNTLTFQAVHPVHLFDCAMSAVQTLRELAGSEKVTDNVVCKLMRELITNSYKPDLISKSSTDDVMKRWATLFASYTDPNGYPQYSQFILQVLPELQTTDDGQRRLEKLTCAQWQTLTTRFQSQHFSDFHGSLPKPPSILRPRNLNDYMSARIEQNSLYFGDIEPEDIEALLQILDSPPYDHDTSPDE